jgi:endoglucanase
VGFVRLSNPSMPRIGGGQPPSGSGQSSSPRPSASESGAHGALDPRTRFLASPPPSGAREQIATLRARGDKIDAGLIDAMVHVPTAVWLTGGSPSDVAGQVGEIGRRAANERAVPVLVLYDIPGRDCSQGSAGGAASGDAYLAWVRAIAGALRGTKAVVILEPDGIALLPSDCNRRDPDGRLRLIASAARILKTETDARVYLDAGHSRWHPTGEIARRLVQAGIDQADGFFENVANFQATDQVTAWGHWVARCVWYGTRVQKGGFSSCPSQYDVPNPDDPATWRLIDAMYDDLVGSVGADELPHFVVDTSRNGLGPWQFPSTYPNDGVAQDWCNPPGRGLGARPAAAPLADNPLVDAYLWIKIPGESDGQCTRGTAGPTDPEWGVTDPAAGQWFPQQALQLAQLADPPLLPQRQ